MAYEVTQRVLFRHCDPAGIVFFPRYFEMVNDCIEHFFDELLHWPFESMHQIGAVPTAEIRTRFLAPSRHGDRLRLRLQVVRVGRSSLGYRLDAECGAERRFEAEATLVYVNETGRPHAWPDEIKQKLISLMENNP